MANLEQSLTDIQQALNNILDDISEALPDVDEDCDLPTLDEVDNSSNKAKSDSGK